MPWAYYDAKGNRVPEEEAVFKGKEVHVDSGVPAPPGLAGTEYHDVHAIAQPDLRKTFKSFTKMKAWFKKHGQVKPKAKPR
jgi:hypothetical protein